MSAPRCQAFTFDGNLSKPCTRPASTERDGHRACVQHAKLARVDWTPAIEFGVTIELPRRRQWWEQD